jgi:hypothetical protein
MTNAAYQGKANLGHGRSVAQLAQVTVPTPPADHAKIGDHARFSDGGV